MKASLYPSWGRRVRVNQHCLIFIGMLDEPSEGYYYFAGQDAIHQLKEKQRSALYKAKYRFCIQAYHLIDELTCL
jgi:putative ABC transport system ATP-binding protein